MTWQGGGGGGLPPGISGDGVTPGGLVVAGALTAGDPNAASVPSKMLFQGAVDIRDNVAVNADGDNCLNIHQDAPLDDNQGGQALWVNRNGVLNGQDYYAPVVDIADNTASVQPIFRIRKNTVAEFQVDGDGVRIHGKLKTGASTAHTLGAYSGKSVPIYDESGTLLGYMPLYA